MEPPPRSIAAAGATMGPDRAVRRMMQFYLWYFAGNGMYAPYLVLYLEAHRVSAVDIGVLAAIPPAVALLSQPFWGHLADRRGAPVAVLRTCLLFGAAVLALVPLLPVPFGTGIGLGVYSAAASATIALADSATLRFLAAGQGHFGSGAYPRIRAYGSLSFALTSVASSLLFANHGLWRAFVAMGVGMAIAAFSLPTAEPPHADGAAHGADAGPAAPSLGAKLGQLIRTPQYAVVVLATFFMQLAGNANATFFPVYLTRVHMAGNLIGTPWSVAAMAEVPVFAFMPLLARRTGVRRLVAVAFVFYAVRYLLFSVIHVAWPVWPIMLLQGFSFSFFTGGMVMLAGSLVPPGLKAVGQTVFMAVGFSLGAVAGNIASGAVVDHLGVLVMYRLAAICSLVAGTLFAGGLWFGRRVATPARVPA